MSKINISFNNAKYSFDKSAISSAKSNLISHLRSIAGEGLIIVVDGVEYSVDPTKLNNAVTDLEAVFSALSGGGNEPIVITWDGDYAGREESYAISGFKVSDEFIPVEKFIGASVTLNTGEVYIIQEDNIQAFEMSYFISDPDGRYLIFGTSDEEGIETPGLYFAAYKRVTEYVSEVRIPNN